MTVGKQMTISGIIYPLELNVYVSPWNYWAVGAFRKWVHGQSWLAKIPDPLEISQGNCLTPAVGPACWTLDQGPYSLAKQVIVTFCSCRLYICNVSGCMVEVFGQQALQNSGQKQVVSILSVECCSPLFLDILWNSYCAVGCHDCSRMSLFLLVYIS